MRPLITFFSEFFFQIFGSQDWAYYLLSQIFVIISFYYIFKFSNEIFNNKLTRYAHKADIIRLQKLLEHGGIYLDIDVLTNKSFDERIEDLKNDIVGDKKLNVQKEQNIQQIYYILKGKC